MRTVNVVPTSCAEANEIVPACAWTMLWQIARPSPQPPDSRERALSIRKNR